VLGDNRPVLNPTPRSKLVDAQGRPYFLWDQEMTLERFEERLHDPDPEVRAYYIGKLMRQAKPDDVFTFVTTNEIGALWPELVPYLGNQRAFWDWILTAWGVDLRDAEAVRREELRWRGPPSDPGETDPARP
jgi:hypothetical protein